MMMFSYLKASITERLDRGRPLTRFSGEKVEVLLYYFPHLAVKGSQRDGCRARFFTEPAVNAPPRHVEGAGEMEGRHLRGDFTQRDKRRVFQGAYIAEADRADIAAAVALNALAELVDPVTEALVKRKGLYGLEGGAIGRDATNFTRTALRGVGLGARALFCQILGAAYPYRDHFGAVELLIPIELNQCLFITSSYHDSEGVLRIMAGDLKDNFGKGIPGVSCGERPHILRIGEEEGYGLSAYLPHS
jgi:hypothetical protein